MFNCDGNITWAKVIGVIVFIYSILKGGVPLFNWFSGRIDAWKKAKTERADKHLSESVGIRQIESDERSKTFEELRQIVEQKDRDIEKLERKIEALEQNHSLPRPMMTKIYAACRKLGTQIENIKFLFKSNASKEIIENELEILEQKFFELDKSLP